MGTQKEHDDYSDKKYRKTLNTTIINNFLDLGRISSNASNYSTLSDFFHHMRNSFKELPHIFVNCLNTNARETLDLTQGLNLKKEDDFLSTAFTEWLLMWLLRVLSQPCTVVHEECKQLLCSLLQLVKINNPCNFREYVIRMISLLSELNVMVEQFIEGKANSITIQNYFKSGKIQPHESEEGNSQELELIDISIVFSVTNECENIAEKLTSVIEILMSDIIQFLPDRYSVLCNQLCVQIELGGLLLKNESILAVTSLIKNNGLKIPTNLANYLFSCLRSIIAFICSFEESAPECLNLLEKSTASLLLELTQKSVLHQYKYNISTSTLGKVLQTLTEVIFQPRFFSVDKNLQVAVVKGIVCFTKHGNENGYTLPLSIHRQFVQKLIDLVATKNSKVLIPLSVFLISMDKVALGDKSRNVSKNYIVDITSPSWSLLYEAMIEKLNGKITETTNLEAICSCMEVLLWSYYEITLRKSEFSENKAWIDNFCKTFSLQILDPFNRIVKNNLARCKSNSQFESIVHVYKILLFVRDKGIKSEQWLIILNVLSVPFMSKSGNVLDLWCEFLPPSSLKKLEIPFSVSIKSECFKLLFLVPTNVSDKWKKVLFLNSLSYDDELKMSSVSVIPFFLYSSPMPSKVMPELVQILTSVQSIGILKEVCKIFGLMCCAVSGTCDLIREHSSGDCLVCKPILKCTKCNKGKEIDGHEQLLDSPPDSLSDLLVYLLSHSSEYLRREILNSLCPYFAHFKVTENVLSTVLHCLVDTDSIVRTKFSEIVQELLSPVLTSKLSECSLQGVEETLITTIQAALLSSKQSESIPFQRTVVHTIGEIGKIANSGLLLIVIISLLESSLSSTPSVKVVAYTKLKQIGVSKKLKMQDLLKSYNDSICKFLAEFLSMKGPDDMNKVLFILEELRLVFEYDNLKSFIQQTQHFILPYLIVKEMTEPSILIQTLASVLSTDKREILINNFPFIFSHFVRQCSKAELEMALKFMQKETGLELGSLLRCYYQPVHNELLLHLSTHYQQVLAGLTILAMKSGDVKGMDIMNHGDAMANYLQPKLLGFLVFFDAQMLKSSLDDKKVALESLISIMKMMGSRAVTAVRYKLMATLRLALRFKEGNFSKICCKAWNTFVCSIEMYCLGPLLNQIIVALLPLLNSEPEGVAEIFRYLVIDKRTVLNEFYHDLYFVPDTPELQDVNAVLKNYNETPSSLTDFCSLLCHSLKGIGHENLEVRLHAIEKLKQVLQGNQKAIHEHLHGRESVDSLISNVVSALITGCRESDVRIRTALGDCLGELGAIDPGRLDMKSVSSKETTNFYNTIDDEKFACALIYKLVHSFLAAEQSGIQDCSACAIQEVLKYYKCSSERGSSGSHLWDCFPPDIQEILGIMSHSQYKPLSKSRKKFPVPIYQSKAGSTFKDWTKNWFYSLLQKVKKENPFKLFHACSIIVKYDLNCTLFLLPHLVVYVLLDSTEIERNELCTEMLTVLRESHQSSTLNDLSHLSSQTVFSIIDHLTKWVHHYLQEIIGKIEKITKKEILSKLADDKTLKIISGCLSSIPQILLAKSAFACQAYARALMHLEKHVKEFPDQLKYNISFIQKIYAALDDPDGVAGIAAIRKEEPSLTDLILENEAIGDMQAAFACYEKAIKLYPNEPSYYGGLLRCFLAMDQPTTAVSYANGTLNDRPEWKDDLNSYRIEAAWKLANWDSLELYLEEEPAKTEWPVGIGNILHLANKKDLKNYEKYANVIRNSQMAPLSAASMEKGAYLRGYEYIIRMHMLTDLQQCVDYIFDLRGENDSPSKGPILLDKILPNLSLRRTLLQSSSRYQEPVHNLHRVLLKIGKEKMPDFSTRFDQEIAKCWLQSARLARKNGYYQRAYNCLLEAGTIGSAEYFMEKTKWLWNKGEKEQAIYCLQKGINEHFPEIHIQRVLNSNVSTEEYLMCGKAKLLLAVYSEESSIVDSNRLIEMYKEVVNLQPDWEASHFHFAKYLDKILSSTEALDAKAELMLKVVQSFGASLKHGCKNVYHSLPRLLDIWFDLGSIQTEESTSSASTSRKIVAMKQITPNLEKISLAVRDLYETIPLYTFMTAFPQLISRICHSHPYVSGPLQKLISRLLVSYPQQSMWMMMAVSKSSYATRSKRCKQIFQDAMNLNVSLVKFVSDATRLADKLIELSNKNVGEEKKLSISENFSTLSKLIGEKNFSQIMLPSQTQMIVTLPNGFIFNVDHNPFPFTPVYIRGFEDTVEVFPSLQKPKKLIVKGSDGKLYPIMCKPKDDLRKDCRLMEFNNLVNRYLKSDPEARRRQLFIRTYAVVPLNEECGLIEWVPNLHGLRLILSKLYKLKGLLVTGREIRAMMPSKTATFDDKLNIFKNQFLPRFPPVFHEWFTLSFSDPTAWYHARLAYARTTAVMSMVGYIVGLGDRHGENILFDSSCGDVVHVDLNCLFNKGETMECPECVPFRLTHNMVDAMGPNGYEGAFRKACEVTMRVIRSKTDALMSVLRPFVHDPLVEWSRSRLKTQHESGEITNEQGLTHVKDIELRLNGIIKYKNKKQGLPLSIEGQVNHLIQEAVDVRNLSQMYIGWAAYM